MPIYNNSEQLYTCLHSLFSQIGDDDPSASGTVATSRLIMRMRTREPDTEVLIDGRTNPIQISYGPSRLRPDIELDLTADALHQILLGELGLKKAIGSGWLKFRGPVWKSFAMESIFRRGQEIYPQIYRDYFRGQPPQ